MSTRLQVILSDAEAAALTEMAAREGITVSEWVTRCLREATRWPRASQSVERLRAIAVAAGHDFPTADIEEMLEDVERECVE